MGGAPGETWQALDSALRILFCTRCYNRLLRPGLAEAIAAEAQPGTILQRRFEELDANIDAWLAQNHMAA